MHKPNCSFWQIWNLCFGFIGIQFGFALQNANVSRIFQNLGASIEDIPLLWIAAPITGLLVQPIIGFLSDKTWNSFGRRRPFLLVGAILASMALIVMPNSPELWIAAGMLWLLDAALNISLGPSIALVGDMLPKHQLSAGFSMQSFFIGMSAVAASSMPWVLTNIFDIPNTAPEGEIPPSVIYSFYIGGAILLLTVFWTVRTTREYSNEELQTFHDLEEKHASSGYGEINTSNLIVRGGLLIAIGLLATVLVMYFDLDKKLIILSLSFTSFGIFKMAAAFLAERNQMENGIYKIMHDLSNMPTTMKQLALVQCLSWFSLFCMWIYATPAVTSFHFHSTDPSSLAYNNGADWVGVLFATYNACAAIAAMTIPSMVRKTNQRYTHIGNLILGGIALLSFRFIDNPTWLLLPMIGLGFAWASILTMPYAILTSTVPPNKLGIYAGLFNVFIVLPQLLASSTMALVIKHVFSGQTIYALMLAGFCMFLAAIATYFVTTSEESSYVASKAKIPVSAEA